MAPWYVGAAPRPRPPEVVRNTVRGGWTDAGGAAVPEHVRHPGRMAREIPEVVRAAAGLTVIVLEEARRLPAPLPGLPVRMIGLAMQKAMWLQQQYSGFVARGDELFTGVRGEDEPGLATFDEDLPADEAPVAGAGFRESAFDRAEVVDEE